MSPDEKTLFEMNDPLNFNASTTLLSNIGKNTTRLSEKLKKDLKSLKEEIGKIIRTGIKNKIFAIEELETSKDSKFYKHIDFTKLGQTK